MLCRIFFGIDSLTRVGILITIQLCNNVYLIVLVTIFVRIKKKDIQWLLDLGYKICSYYRVYPNKTP